MEQREKDRSMEFLRQKNEFFIKMSHELKTPLSLIIAPLGTLIRATRAEYCLEEIADRHPEECLAAEHAYS